MEDLEAEIVVDARQKVERIGQSSETELQKRLAEIHQQRGQQGEALHDFCSSRTSGRIFFSSASAVMGPICL